MSNEELVRLIKKEIDKEENLLKLFQDNRKLIVKMVKPFYRGCDGNKGVPVVELEELVQESFFGLIKAVEEYKESEGVLFFSYAAHYIKQSARRYIENCGHTVRVPVHKQQQIFQYNQASSYYLQYFNRKPNKYEYARWLDINAKKVEELEKYMFRGKIKSLDEPITNNENDEMCIADIVVSDESVENDVVNRVAEEQIRNDIWCIVRTILKNDQMFNVIRYRYIDNLSLEEISNRIGESRECVRKYESKAVQRLRNNSRFKRLGIELELLHDVKYFQDKIINLKRIKSFVKKGYHDVLDSVELEYAKMRKWI